MLEWLHFVLGSCVGEGIIIIIIKVDFSQNREIKLIDSEWLNHRIS